MLTCCIMTTVMIRKIDSAVPIMVTHAMTGWLRMS
jgi:hypothetical protein